MAMQMTTLIRRPKQMDPNDPMYTAMAMLTGDSLVKKMIVQYVAGVVNALLASAIVLETMMQQQVQLKEQEAFLRDSPNPKAEGRSPDVVQRHQEILHKLEMLYTSLADAITNHNKLLDKYETLKQQEPVAVNSVELQQQQQGQARRDLANALQKILPQDKLDSFLVAAGKDADGNKTYKLSDALESQVQESVDAKATMVEAEARYIKSRDWAEAADAKTAPPKVERSQLQVALRFNVMQELKLRFLINNTLEESGIADPQVRKQMVKAFFKEYLHQAEVIKRAEALESELNPKDAEYVADKLTVEHGVAFFTEAQEQCRELQNEIAISRVTVNALAREYSDTLTRSRGLCAELGMPAPTGKRVFDDVDEHSAYQRPSPSPFGSNGK